MTIEEFYEALNNAAASMRRKIRKKQSENVSEKDNYRENEYIENCNKERIMIDGSGIVDIF